LDKKSLESQIGVLRLVGLVGLVRLPDLIFAKIGYYKGYKSKWVPAERSFIGSFPYQVLIKQGVFSH